MAGLDLFDAELSAAAFGAPWFLVDLVGEGMVAAIAPSGEV
jgi:hypothetical protein